MNEIPLEYWNKLASQLIMISSLLSGFSIAVTANLLVYKSDKRIIINILKSTTVVVGGFLVGSIYNDKNSNDDYSRILY